MPVVQAIDHSTEKHKQYILPLDMTALLWMALASLMNAQNNTIAQNNLTTDTDDSVQYYIIA